MLEGHSPEIFTELDSLKISLQIISEGHPSTGGTKSLSNCSGQADFRNRIVLYEHKQSTAVSQKAAEVLKAEAGTIEISILNL